jgi:hypothetical protein
MDLYAVIDAILAPLRGHPAGLRALRPGALMADAVELLARDDVEVSVMDCSAAPGGTLFVVTGGTKPEWMKGKTA